MRRLPASPSRAQALNEFEPILLRNFQHKTTGVNPEVRDAMHYALFSVGDRFCTSAGWLIAPRLGVSVDRFSSAACAIETLRCSLAFKTRPTTQRTEREKFVEPALAEAASYGLIPLAFEMVLSNEDNALPPAERGPAAAILARAASPVHMLSALHRESTILRDSIRPTISRQELYDLSMEKVAPAFHAVGEMLTFLASGNGRAPVGLAPWFRKLGLFAHWVDELCSPATSQRVSTLALGRVMTLPEAMDLIKTVEAELFESARTLDIQGAAHEIIEPVAEILKTQLQ